MATESPSTTRDRRTRRREGRRLGDRDSGHQPRPVEVIRPPTAAEVDAVEVARRWSQALSRGDVDTLMSCYDPQAVVHLEGQVLVEHLDIVRGWQTSRHWAREPVGVVSERADDRRVEGFDVTIGWSGAGRGGVDVESRLRVVRGVIVEQWHGDVMYVVPVVGPALEVSLAGEVTSEERDHAVASLWRILDTCEPPPLRARLRLERYGDPARPEPVSARVWVDLEHVRLVARALGSTVGEASARVDARLRHQLEQQASRVKAVRRRGPTSPPGHWRHGDQSETHHVPMQLPDDQRVVMVRSTWAGGREHIDEAIEDLEALDLEVLLFEEQTTGDAAVVWGHGDGYVVRCAGGGDPSPRWTPSPVATVTVDEQPFPEMDLESARLALSWGDSWLVFRDTGTGRPGLLYRRVDGHDGLVVLDRDHSPRQRDR
jgi:hypothetical protein